MQSNHPRLSLLSSLLATAGLAMAASTPLLVRQREQPPTSPQRAQHNASARDRCRTRAPGWHDPAKVAAAEAKRARKARHLRHCAERMTRSTT